MHNFIDFMNSQIELSDMKSGEVILQTHLSWFANVPLMHVKKKKMSVYSHFKQVTHITMYLPM